MYALFAESGKYHDYFTIKYSFDHTFVRGIYFTHLKVITQKYKMRMSNELQTISIAIIICFIFVFKF